jgi:hypothetical protein
LGYGDERFEAIHGETQDYLAIGRLKRRLGLELKLPAKDASVSG